MTIANTQAVKDYEEKRALDAVLAGQQADTSALKDYAFRRAIISINTGSPMPELGSIKDFESKRILQQIKNTGV